MRVLSTIATCGFVWLSGPSTAFGAPVDHGTAAPDTRAVARTGAAAEARALYQRGVDAYRVHHYQDAIKAFVQADTLVPSAAHSFNIARSYERIGDPLRAATWYRDYLQRAGPIRERALVEERIAMLEASMKEGKSRPPVVLPAPGDPASSLDESPPKASESTASSIPERLKLTAPRLTDDAALRTSEPGTSKAVFRTSGLVALGLGGASLAGAAVFEILRHGADSDPQGYDIAQRRETAAQVLTGAGAALLATGGVLLFVSSRNNEGKQPGVTAACAVSGCSAAVYGKF